MLIGSHVIVYAQDVEKTRAFFRDTLGFAHVDAGEGWLIFALPPAELGVHPAETGGKHQLFLMCDDIEKTKAELTGKGVTFTQPVTDQGWGIVTAFELPGAGEFWIYQPRHPLACRPATKPSSAAKSHRKEKKVSGTTRRTGRKSQKRLEAILAAKRRRRRTR